MKKRRLGKKELEGLFGITFPELDGCYDWKAKATSAAQKKFMHSLDLNTSEFKYQGHASAAISFMLKREAWGLATVKQVIFMLDNGILADFQTITKAEASRKISKYISERRYYF